MSETSHLKCPCQHCGGSIEFPTDGLGQLATCPHCGAETTLFAPVAAESPDPSGAAADSAPVADTSVDPSTESPAGDSTESTFEAEEGVVGNERPGSKRKLLWIALPLLGLVGTAAFFIFKDRSVRPQSPAVNENGSATNLEASKVVASAPTNAFAPTKAPKSIDDLKVGPISLEKSKGSSLVYAVGVLRNDSGHQRFGVNLELELTDARGNKAGTAKDYRTVIEPRQEWRFRALVLDSKAVSAKVAAIREEE